MIDDRRMMIENRNGRPAGAGRHFKENHQSPRWLKNMSRR
jgi:hypothetical protein